MSTSLSDQHACPQPASHATWRTRTNGPITPSKRGRYRMLSTKVRSLANFAWSVADLLRGDFKQFEYGKIILPFLVVGACNHSGACSQTARFPAHAFCHWQGPRCSNYLPMCSPSSGAACKRGVVLTLPANGFSKPVAGRRFCEAGFKNSSDKRRAAEMRCGHGPPRGRQKGKFSRTAGGA